MQVTVVTQEIVLGVQFNVVFNLRPGIGALGLPDGVSAWRM